MFFVFLGPVVSCHSRQRPHDHERVKKFMKVKRHKAMADRKVKNQEARKKKAQVQERLLALEAFRKTQVLLHWQKHFLSVFFVKYDDVGKNQLKEA